MVVGFNIPAFGLLDVVAYEFEWFSSKYPNDYYQVEYSGYPIPVPNQNPQSATYTPARCYWSLYLKKTFAGHVYFVTQFGRDHSRLSSFDNQYKVEAMPGEKHWSWRGKLGVSL
jgi:hypothetical protein